MEHELCSIIVRCGTSRLSQRKERRFGTKSEERGAVANRAVRANREGIDFLCPNRSHSEWERQPLNNPAKFN